MYTWAGYRPKYRKLPSLSDLLVINLTHVMTAIDFAATDEFLSSSAYSVHSLHYLPTALQLTFIAALTISIDLSDTFATEMQLSRTF